MRQNTLMLLLLALFVACSKSDGNETGLKADFTVEMIDANNYRFTDASQGAVLNSWDLGNGTVLENRSQVNAYYPQKGDFNVKLTVWAEGQSNTASKKVEITEDDLMAAFSVSNGSEPNTFVFNNLSKGNYDEILWDFGNDLTSDKDDPGAVYYPFRGQYDVVLTLVKEGVQVTASDRVSVGADDPDYINKMSLVWSDEFDGSEVNDDHWTFETGASGWGNNEWQDYTDGDNAEVKDGMLTITARKRGAGQRAGDYTSTRMITKGKQEFKYGRMEIRAKLPGGRGIWPAIWMLGGNIDQVGWPACGEIDIMEHVGFEPTKIHGSLHSTSSSGATQNTGTIEVPDCETELHNYGVLWTPQSISFYIDTPDNVYYTYNPASKNAETWPFAKPHFFILNIAVGGTWGGMNGVDDNIFPQTMEVDYVRVYQFTQD